MSWKYIMVGNYGFEGRLTLVKNGAAEDISSYTTTQFVLTAPDKTTSTKSATFVTDGSDGQLAYVFQSGDISSSGYWHVRARIAKSGVQIDSENHRFYVGD